jgi:hypothetical protein
MKKILSGDIDLQIKDQLYFAKKQEFIKKVVQILRDTLSNVTNSANSGSDKNDDKPATSKSITLLISQIEDLLNKTQLEKSTIDKLLKTVLNKVQSELTPRVSTNENNAINEELKTKLSAAFDSLNLPGDNSYSKYIKPEKEDVFNHIDSIFDSLDSSDKQKITREKQLLEERIKDIIQSKDERFFSSEDISKLIDVKDKHTKQLHDISQKLSKLLTPQEKGKERSLVPLGPRTRLVEMFEAHYDVDARRHVLQLMGNIPNPKEHGLRVHEMNLVNQMMIQEILRAVDTPTLRKELESVLEDIQDDLRRHLVFRTLNPDASRDVFERESQAFLDRAKYRFAAGENNIAFEVDYYFTDPGQADGQGGHAVRVVINRIDDEMVELRIVDRGGNQVVTDGMVDIAVYRLPVDQLLGSGGHDLITHFMTMERHRFPNYTNLETAHLALHDAPRLFLGIEPNRVEQLVAQVGPNCGLMCREGALEQRLGIEWVRLYRDLFQNLVDAYQEALPEESEMLRARITEFDRQIENYEAKREAQQRELIKQKASEHDATSIDKSINLSEILYPEPLLAKQLVDLTRIRKYFCDSIDETISKELQQIATGGDDPDPDPGSSTETMFEDGNDRKPIFGIAETISKELQQIASGSDDPDPDPGSSTETMFEDENDCNLTLRNEH